MKRAITVRVKGAVRRLFERWPVPDNVEYTEKGNNHAVLRFDDAATEAFYDLEQAAEELSQEVEIKARFSAHQFSDEECSQALLLAFFLTCDRGIDLKQPPSDVLVMQSETRAVFLSEHPLEGEILLTCSNLYLFHRSFVDTLKQRNLTQGLHCVPAIVEVAGMGIDEEWVWVTSRVDLGTPLLERRFLKGFQSRAWNNVAFCSSAFYDWKLLFVSQPVYRLIAGLPQVLPNQVEFEPVELV